MVKDDSPVQSIQRQKTIQQKKEIEEKKKKEIIGKKETQDRELKKKDRYVSIEHNKTTDTYTLIYKLPSSLINHSFQSIDITESQMSIQNVLEQIDKSFYKLHIKVMSRLRREISKTLAELGVREKNLVIRPNKLKF